MSTRVKFELVGAAVIVLLLAVLAVSYHRNVVATARAEEAEKVHAQENQRIDNAIAQAEAKWNSDRQALLAIIQKAPAQSPAQIVKTIPQVIELPKPIYLEPSQPGTTNGTGTDAAPAPTGNLVVPAESAPKLLSELAAGQVCKGDLAVCQVAREGYQQQRDNAMKDAENWKRAAKGSTGKRVLKGLGCAVLAGGGALLGNKVGGDTGAAVGGSVGAGACVIAW